MKRRSFLSQSALSTVPLVARVADKADQQGWHEDTLNASKFEAVADDGKIAMRMELVRPAENEVTEATDAKGEFRSYQYRGKDQPDLFHRGKTLLTHFDLTWSSKAMPIPERCGEVLPGVRVETSPLNPTCHWKAGGFLERLRQPRDFLSAKDGTVLTEWERLEKCDSHSASICLIVSRSGFVIRHRDSPQHEW